MKNAINGTDTEAEAEFTTLGVAALGVVEKLRKQRTGNHQRSASSRDKAECRNLPSGQAEEKQNQTAVEDDRTNHPVLLIFALRRTR